MDFHDFNDDGFICIKTYIAYTYVWFVVYADVGSLHLLWSISIVFRHRGPFYLHGLALFSAPICIYIHYKVWDEITYPFLNFNSGVEG